MVYPYLWAMVRTVLPVNSTASVCWMRASVSMSTLAVASSKQITYILDYNAAGLTDICSTFDYKCHVNGSCDWIM